MYKIYEVEGLNFYIKYDLVDDTYMPHITYRHFILPEDAIKTYFNITKQRYNEIYMRYEAYSKDTGITIYYTYKQDKKDEILIITAF